MIENPTSARCLVKNALLENIRRQEIGTRLSPERRLAEEFGVSRSTMSKVLEELVNEGYLSRRVGSGTFIMPRDAEITSIRLAARTRGEVVVASPDYFSYSIWNNLHQLEIAAMRANLQLVNLKIHPESDFNSILELASGCRNLLGIVYNLGKPLPKPLLRNLDNVGVPVVLIGELDNIGAYENLFSVRNNHYQSGFLKMEALLAAGHRRIGLVPNEPGSIAGQDCIRGMKEAIRQYKLRWRDLVLPESSIEFWQDPMQCGCVQTREVLEKAPDVTALLVDTIPGAIGALRAVGETGRRCPDDISIVTAMSYANIESFTFPSISTVVSSTEKQIDAVLEIILRGGEVSSREIVVDVEYIPRESIRNIAQ